MEKMDLAVIYLRKVRKHVIIPEKYIYDFNLNALKNYGKNPSRDQLVYWSDECIEGRYYPDINPNAVISEVWPAPTGAWFYGRVLLFTGKYRLNTENVLKNSVKIQVFKSFID